MKDNTVVAGAGLLRVEVIPRRSPSEPPSSRPDPAAELRSAVLLAEPIQGNMVVPDSARALPGRETVPLRLETGGEGTADPFFGRAPSRPPDEDYIHGCYERILALNDGRPLSEVKKGIEGILFEMAEKAEREGRSYTLMANGALMLHWTRGEGESTSYDGFMQEHLNAIKTLVTAWMKNRVPGGGKINVLDVSCGTGASLEAVLDTLPPKLFKKIRVTANDASSASLEVARKRMQKYAGRVRSIEFTQFDLTQQLPKGKFDLIICSQTLPFINDEAALRAQRLGRSLPSESRHTTAKKRGLERLVAKLKPDKGELLLIDEHPMKLSSTPDTFDSMVESTLFGEIFRKIGRGLLINEVLKRVGSARFEGHLETPIDRVHSMFLMAYRNESPVAGRRHGGHHFYGDPNDGDVRTIIRRMEGMHPELVRRLQTFEAPNGTVYKRIGEDDRRLVIDQDHYREKIEGTRAGGYWRTNGHFDLVVVPNLIHVVGMDGYRTLIEKLKKSEKAGPGAAMLFIDEWPAPQRCDNPVGNTDARTMVLNTFDDHVFCGSVRVGNKYGYLYLVRSL
jgi:SAM-dependent methyltransferase